MTMRPLAALPRDGVRGVLTDIDDTLTTHGRLPARAFRAMERLYEAGLLVIPITGRPAGWCDHIARMWPVAGVVGENGGRVYIFDRGSGDCLAGCSEHVYYGFRVDPSGVTDLGSWDSQDAGTRTPPNWVTDRPECKKHL